MRFCSQQARPGWPPSHSSSTSLRPFWRPRASQCWDLKLRGSTRAAEVEAPRPLAPNEPIVEYVVNESDCDDDNDDGVCDCPSDGDPCTEDKCVSQPARQDDIVWICAHLPLTNSPCEDDGDRCTYDVCAEGFCVHPPIPDGAQCEADGNQCTTDYCLKGICNSGTPRICLDDGNPCTLDYCDPGDGACTHPPGNNGAMCDDDDDPCTLDICNNGACTHPPGNDGAECEDDGEVCTDDICQSGACIHPPGNNGAMCDDDDDPCTIDLCNNGACTHPPGNEGAACDDEKVCTENDKCVQGACVGDVDCDDGDPCTEDGCDPTGECQHQPISCSDDGNPCTDDVCIGGTCGVPISGPSCDDGSECTSGDQCVNGACVGMDVVCDDGDACTIDNCDPQTGCYADPVVCNDGDPCTEDYCEDGVCMSGHSNCEEQEDPCNTEPFQNSYSECNNCTVTLNVPDTIPLNCDDDNNNGVRDYLEPGPVLGEDDLIPMIISRSGGCPGMGYPIADTVWRLAEGSGNRTYRVYRNPNKTELVDSGAGYQPWPPPSTVWLEGIAPTQDCPSRVVFWMGVTYKGGGFCIYCGYEGEPTQALGVLMTAETIDQDDPTNSSWQSITDGAVVYGGSEASTADNLRLTLSAPGGNVVDVSWSWSGDGAATFAAPPTGPDALVWDLGDMLAPVPGEIEFAAEVFYDTGSVESCTFKVEIGVRTDDVIVVGWIDPNNVPLNSALTTPALLTLFPVAGPPIPTAPPCSACEVLTAVASGVTNTCGLVMNTIDLPQPAGDSNRAYLLHWMFKYGANVDPSTVIPGGDFRNGADTHTDDTEVWNFILGLTGFKLLNRLQVRFRADPSGMIGTPVLLQSLFAIGATTNPAAGCPLALNPSPGQSGPNDGKLGQTNQSIWQVNEGSPDVNGVLAFHTLVGNNAVPADPKFWESIGSRIRFRFDNGTEPIISVQAYPTYYEYHNGRLVAVHPQQPDPQNSFYLYPYPFGAVPCNGTTEYGSIPVPHWQGRCGNAVATEESSARIPPFLP